MTIRRRLLLAIGALLVACGTAPPEAIQSVQPEAASGFQTKSAAVFERQAVVAAHPLAAQTGAAILRAGGNAVDAAIASQLVLGLVEPQSSGIGGGGFLILWDGQRLHAYDGRETAPAAAPETLFLRADGSPLPRDQAERSGLAVGVPGLLRLLETVHRGHGRLPWAELFAPAIRIAEQGFAMGPRLHELLRVDAHLRSEPAAAALFYGADGQPLPVGSLLRNPAQAALLRRVAREGAEAFYGGAIADDLLRRVRGQARPGSLTLADLQAYRVERREPLCFAWRQRRLCGLPPPASGLLLNAQLLQMLDAAGPAAALMTAEGLHRYTEAARLAIADRDLYAADPAFVPAGAAVLPALLRPAYLAERAALIGPRAATTVLPGRPAGLSARLAPQAEVVEQGTTHLSTVDAQGMAVALTSSVEAAFGTRMLLDGGSGLAGGYFLNNQLTDFAFRPRGADGQPVANRVQGGKRPRSSMNPMLVFDAKGELEMVLGSPGGLAIPHYTARLLLLTLGEGQGLQAAVDAPNFIVVPPRLLVEAERVPAVLQQALSARGHSTRESSLTSGLHALQRLGGRWIAAADPRREGQAAGD
ncbi:MAG: gamma-glutamyltransferase family protein [Inhella sp.]